MTLLGLTYTDMHCTIHVLLFIRAKQYPNFEYVLIDEQPFYLLCYDITCIIEVGHTKLSEHFYTYLPLLQYYIY